MTKKGYQNLTLNQLVDWADTLDEAINEPCLYCGKNLPNTDKPNYTLGEAIKEYFKQKEESK